jgi:hypothetical protein
LPLVDTVMLRMLWYRSVISPPLAYGLNSMSNATNRSCGGRTGFFKPAPTLSHGP